MTLAFFSMDTIYEKEMVNEFETLSSIKKFNLQINGFDTFKNGSMVLILDISRSESIVQIHRNAQELWSTKLKEKASKLTISKTPHMTISTMNDKDILEASFKKFDAVGYQRNFEVDQLVLTSRLPFKTWDWEHRIRLNSTSE